MSDASFYAGIVQFAPQFGDPDANLRRLRELVLGTEPADLLVAPELALTGYLFRNRDELMSLAQQPGGDEEQALCELAADVGCHLAVGVAERVGDDIFNGALLCGPDGVVGRYHKTHLFAEEKDLFAPGETGFPVWDVGGVKVGLMVCFDWIFPEAARSLALNGADVIAHPCNLVLPHCQRVMPARCLENRVFAVTANRHGGERRGVRSLRFTGGSVIVGPGGRVMHTAPVDEDQVAVVEMHTGAARDKFITPRNHVLMDRRPDQYE